MTPPDDERHAAYTHALQALLPSGEVWPREPDSTIMRVVAWLARLPARWAADVRRFLGTEAYPPAALVMLPDWERNLGLPEPCLPATGLTIAERRAAVVEKLARRPGRQDRHYFLEVAGLLGYSDITITEHIPAQAGMTPCGAYRTTENGGRLIVIGAGAGTPFIRYVWKINVSGPRLTWFSVGAGGGRAGQDPHLTVRRAEDLECVLRRLAPAHTRLIFSYSGD